jgi:hypothetical protein
MPIISGTIQTRQAAQNMAVAGEEEEKRGYKARFPFENGWF